MQRLLDLLEGGYIIGDVKPSVLVKFIEGELIEYEKNVIMDAFNEGYRQGEHDATDITPAAMDISNFGNSESYYEETFNAE